MVIIHKRCLILSWKYLWEFSKLVKIMTDPSPDCWISAVRRSPRGDLSYELQRVITDGMFIDGHRRGDALDITSRAPKHPILKEVRILGLANPAIGWSSMGPSGWSTSL